MPFSSTIPIAPPVYIRPILGFIDIVFLQYLQPFQQVGVVLKYIELRLMTSSCYSYDSLFSSLDLLTLLSRPNEDK